MVQRSHIWHWRWKRQTDHLGTESLYRRSNKGMFFSHCDFNNTDMMYNVNIEVFYWQTIKQVECVISIETFWLSEDSVFCKWVTWVQGIEKHRNYQSYFQIAAKLHSNHYFTLLEQHLSQINNLKKVYCQNDLRLL